MKPEYKVNFANLDWITRADHIRYKCYQHGGYQVRLVEFGKAMVHSDWCIKGHLGYIIEGEMEIRFSGVTEVYKPGDALFIPDGDEHQHRPKVLTEKVVFFSVEKI